MRQMRQLRVGRVCPNSHSWIEEKLGCQPPIVPTQQGKALSTCGHGLQSTQCSTALFWGWSEEKQTNPGEAVPFVLELSGATLSWAVLSSKGLSCCFPGAVSRFFHCCFRPVDAYTVYSSQEAEAPFLLMQGLLLLQGRAARSQPQACHTLALRFC